MQVGFTESKDARVVLEHKCFKICEISPQTSYIVVDSKRCGGDLGLELPGLLFDFAPDMLHRSENKRWTTVNFW